MEWYEEVGIRLSNSDLKKELADTRKAVADNENDKKSIIKVSLIIKELDRRVLLLEAERKAAWWAKIKKDHNMK